MITWSYGHWGNYVCTGILIQCQVEDLEQFLLVCATCRIGAKIIRNRWANNFDRGAICSPHIAFTKCRTLSCFMKELKV